MYIAEPKVAVWGQLGWRCRQLAVRYLRSGLDRLTLGDTVSYPSLHCLIKGKVMRLDLEDAYVARCQYHMETAAGWRLHSSPAGPAERLQAGQESCQLQAVQAPATEGEAVSEPSTLYFVHLFLRRSELSWLSPDLAEQWELAPTGQAPQALAFQF